MEWQQIVGFYHVAKLSSFSRAAEATFRTQSALSQQVKALETSLDCILLERIGRRRLQLTPAGERVFRYCRDVLAGYDRLRGELNELAGLKAGRLTIAAPMATFKIYLPDTLAGFGSRHPDIRLRLLERTPHEIIELVRDGEADIGFLMESVAPKDLESCPWKEAMGSLLVPTGHPLAEGGPPELRQIASYPLIVPPKHLKYSARSNLEARLESEGLAYDIAMESTNMVLTADYVELGLGIGFATLVPAPRIFADRRLEIIPLPHLFQGDALSVVYRRGVEAGAVRMAFFDVLFGKAG